MRLLFNLISNNGSVGTNYIASKTLKQIQLPAV